MAGHDFRKIFGNVAVKDPGKSVEFFTKLGFAFDARFSDERATCMIVSDEAFVMLLVEDRFKDFTTKEICDATTMEAVLALSAASREQVDELVNRARAAPANDANEQGSMYGRSFQDLDGNIWEPSGWTRARLGHKHRT